MSYIVFFPSISSTVCLLIFQLRPPYMTLILLSFWFLGLFGVTFVFFKILFLLFYYFIYGLLTWYFNFLLHRWYFCGHVWGLIIFKNVILNIVNWNYSMFLGFFIRSSWLFKFLEFCFLMFQVIYLVPYFVKNCLTKYFPLLSIVCFWFYFLIFCYQVLLG